MITNRFRIALMIVLTAAGLTACGGDHVVRNPQVAALPDKVSMMLADAADRSANALQTLAAIEQQRTPEIAAAPIDNAPPELRRAITVNWVGPVEPIAKMMADRAGYGYQVVGVAPPVPIIVSIDAENKPVIEILRNIGLQLGVRADVRVDGTTSMVEIHYAPHAGIGG